MSVKPMWKLQNVFKYNIIILGNISTSYIIRNIEKKKKDVQVKGDFFLEWRCQVVLNLSSCLVRNILMCPSFQFLMSICFATYSIFVSTDFHSQPRLQWWNQMYWSTWTNKDNVTIFIKIVIVESVFKT